METRHSSRSSYVLIDSIDAHACVEGQLHMHAAANACRISKLESMKTKPVLGNQMHSRMIGQLVVHAGGGV